MLLPYEHKVMNTVLFDVLYVFVVVIHIRLIFSLYFNIRISRRCGFVDNPFVRHPYALFGCG